MLSSYRVRVCPAGKCSVNAYCEGGGGGGCVWPACQCSDIPPHPFSSWLSCLPMNLHATGPTAQTINFTLRLL